MTKHYLQHTTTCFYMDNWLTSMPTSIQVFYWDKVQTGCSRRCSTMPRHSSRHHIPIHKCGTWWLIRVFCGFAWRHGAQCSNSFNDIMCRWMLRISSCAQYCIQWIISHTNSSSMDLTLNSTRLTTPRNYTSTLRSMCSGLPLNCLGFIEINFWIIVSRMRSIRSYMITWSNTISSLQIGSRFRLLTNRS